MNHTPPTAREAALTRITNRIIMQGRVGLRDIETLNQFDIPIQDHLAGLVSDPTTAISRGELTAPTLLQALTRWAHPTPQG